MTHPPYAANLEQIYPAMRILVLSNLYPPHYVGGYELRCRDISEALHDRGHTIEVLTSSHQLEGITSAESSPFRVRRDLRLHGFFGHPWLSITDLVQLEQANNQTLLSAIQEFQPDLVHVWNLGGISKSLALTLQRLGIPTVFDVSDHWIAQSLVGDVWLDWWNRRFPSLPARLLRFFWSLTGRRREWSQTAPTNPLHHLRFSRLYFCSSRLRQLTERAGYPVAHGQVIHCPVNTERYHGSVAPPSQPLNKLLFAGRLAEDKGILTALKAMQQVRDLFPGSLHVYGKGEPAYETMLRDFVTEHRLPVTFHHATPEQMPDVYRAHDALLFTSEWEEPFALTPLEAMASGLPVIGTLTGGSAELLRHGQNAFTYSAGDASELASRIATLSSNPALRSTIAQTGQDEVRSTLNLNLITSQIESYLTESLATWQSPSLPAYHAA